MNDSHNPYDIIFMDCNMPILDGFQASTQIKELYAAKKIKHYPYICALTAYTTGVFRTKCFNSGMRNYLSKPVSSIDLD